MAKETPDPDREIGLQAAAEILGFSAAHVLELLNNGAIAYRIGEPVLIRLGDVETWKLEFERGETALDDIARIVGESPGGWDDGFDE